MEKKVWIRGAFFMPLLFSCTSAFNPQISKLLEPVNWKMFRGDGQNSGYLSKPWQVPSRLLWKYNTGAPIYSTPVVTGGMVIFGGLDRKLHFVDIKIGQKLASLSFPSSISASCALQDTLLFLGTESGGDAIYALNLKNFRIVWKKKLRDIAGSPIIDDKVYIGTSNGTMLAFEAGSGVEAWRYKASEGIKSAVAIVESVLYFTSLDSNLYALNKTTGSLIWSFKAGSSVYASPAVGEGKIYFGDMNGIFYALDRNTGKPLWQFQTGGKIYSSAAVSDSIVYFGSNDGKLRALEGSTGEMKWEFKTEGLIHSSPVVVGDWLVFGSFDGRVYFLDKKDGQLLWKYNTSGSVSASPCFADGKVFISSRDKNLYCLGN